MVCKALWFQQHLHCGPVEKRNFFIQLDYPKFAKKLALNRQMLYHGLKSPVNKKCALSPYNISMGKPIRFLHTPPKPLHQSKLQMTNNIMWNYWKALIKCVRIIHLQVKEAFIEHSSELCHSWEPRDLGLRGGDTQMTEDQQNGTHKGAMSSRSQSLYNIT